MAANSRVPCAFEGLDKVNLRSLRKISVKTTQKQSITFRYCHTTKGAFKISLNSNVGRLLLWLVGASLDKTAAIGDYILEVTKHQPKKVVLAWDLYGLTILGGEAY